MKKYIVLLICVSIYTVTCAQHLKNKIEGIVNKHKAVGVAYVVVKDGNIIHQDAVGYKNIENKTILDPAKDLFRIASISKSFTATALMQLVEKGKLSLEDDFGNLIGFSVRNPNYPDKVITLKMILSHTSSINDKNGYFNLDAINPNKNPDWKKGYNNYEPGTNYQYCNLNFNMAGAALERAVGIRFDSYIKQQILNPLELTGGYCVDSLDNNKFVTLYEFNNDKDDFEAQTMAYAPRTEEINNYIQGYTTPIFSPTGGMKISATDLARYMIMHMNYGKIGKMRVIRKSTSKIMQTKVNADSGYGLALRESDDFIKGMQLIGHTGSAYGLFSAMFFNPKTKFGFVVITNGCIPVYQNGEPTFLKELANVLYEDLVK